MAASRDATPDRLEVQARMEERLSELGYDLVQLEWAGSPRRPVVRLRVERSALDRPVSVGDCTKVSRSLEPWLEAEAGMPERYVLEVSSPGLDRPLTRGRDFDRFRGRRVAVKGREALCGRALRLEGELLGLSGADNGSGAIRLRLGEGDEVEVPRSKVEAAHLVHQWRTP